MNLEKTLSEAWYFYHGTNIISLLECVHVIQMSTLLQQNLREGMDMTLFIAVVVIVSKIGRYNFAY